MIHSLGLEAVTDNTEASKPTSCSIRPYNPQLEKELQRLWIVGGEHSLRGGYKRFLEMKQNRLDETTSQKVLTSLAYG